MVWGADGQILPGVGGLLVLNVFTHPGRVIVDMWSCGREGLIANEESLAGLVVGKVRSKRAQKCLRTNDEASSAIIASMNMYCNHKYV